MKSTAHRYLFYFVLTQVFCFVLTSALTRHVRSRRFTDARTNVVYPPSEINDINLGVILPQSLQYPWAIPRVMPAIQYAVETVQAMPNVLTNYRINTRIGDSKCSDTYGPLEAIDMYVHRTANVFLGPACDFSIAPIARFSPHWNIPVITGRALVHAFDDKNEYGLLTRITGPYRKLGELFIDLFSQFNWNVTGLMYNDNGVRAGTDCWFVMEAVYHILRNHYGGTADFWYKSFSEGGASQSQNSTGANNLKSKLHQILEEASLNTRGMITPYNRFSYLTFFNEYDAVLNHVSWVVNYIKLIL